MQENVVYFTPFPELKTERLLLRQLRKEDEQEIFFLRSDDRVMEFIARTKATSLTDAQEFIQRVKGELLLMNRYSGELPCKVILVLSA